MSVDQRTAPPTVEERLGSVHAMLRAAEREIHGACEDLLIDAVSVLRNVVADALDASGRAGGDLLYSARLACRENGFGANGPDGIDLATWLRRQFAELRAARDCVDVLRTCVRDDLVVVEAAGVLAAYDATKARG